MRSVGHTNIAVVCYLTVFMFAVVCSWGLRNQVKQAVLLKASMEVQQKRLADAVEGLNTKLGRYEQEYERRAVQMMAGCESIRRQLYESMLTPAERFHADALKRLQVLEDRLKDAGAP